MAQGNTQVPTTGPLSPAAFAGDINTALLALLSQNSGNSAPANGPGGAPVLGQSWIDTSVNPYVVKVYDGASWVITGTINPTTHIFTPVTAAAFGAQTNIASAATTDLGTLASRNGNVTGSTTISSFGNSASLNNPLYLTKFAGAVQLTNSANLIVPGGANYTTAAGDVFMWQFEGSSTWRCVSYSLASGNAIGQLAVPEVVAGTTVSNAANIQFSFPTSGFFAYDVYLQFLPTTNNVQLLGQFDDALGGIAAAGHQWSYIDTNSNSSGSNVPHGNASFIQFAQAVNGIGGMLKLTVQAFISGGTVYISGTWNASWLDQIGSTVWSAVGSFRAQGNIRMAKLTFAMSSGNISGTYRVVGIPQ